MRIPVMYSSSLRSWGSWCMDSITVVIPAQVFDEYKYAPPMDNRQRCYLEEALDKAGHPGSIVYALGFTSLYDRKWKTAQRFSAMILRDAFARGESVTVTLVPNGK